MANGHLLQIQMLFVSGDMNSQGFPCSGKTNCASSQGGRGGMFFGFQNKQLHQSLSQVVSTICDCGSGTKASYRMCGYGCQRYLPSATMERNAISFMPQPDAFSQNSSVWASSGKGWRTASLDQATPAVQPSYNSSTTLCCFFNSQGCSQGQLCCNMDGQGYGSEQTCNAFGQGHGCAWVANKCVVGA